MLATSETVPQRRVIAHRLHKLIDDERMSDDIFALTMNFFDRFIHQSTESSKIWKNNRYCQLIALSCYSLAKKLRATTSINNENEQMTLILSDERYQDDEIFEAEQTILETLDWDLSVPIPHDYIDCLFSKNVFSPDDQRKLRLHLHVLLALALCELSTLVYNPTLLACACFKAALKGLRFPLPSKLDRFFVETMHCNRLELMQSQSLIEQLFQSCLQDILPRPSRRCLMPIEPSSQQQRQPRTRVK